MYVLELHSHLRLLANCCTLCAKSLPHAARQLNHGVYRFCTRKAQRVHKLQQRQQDQWLHGTIRESRPMLADVGRWAAQLWRLRLCLACPERSSSSVLSRSRNVSKLARFDSRLVALPETGLDLSPEDARRVPAALSCGLSATACTDVAPRELLRRLSSLLHNGGSGPLGVLGPVELSRSAAPRLGARGSGVVVAPAVAAGVDPARPGARGGLSVR
mmetsp:Transcript_153637/g.271175  ORF Transcript_153637/g.271175 Transcript_153637/m.271175 type:complete len:216 (-) Transcript_153637:1057-1704(-)